MKKRVEFTEDYFRDWWLTKYHNTNCRELVEKEPELCMTVEWFAKYPCTQEAHDEWFAWAISEVKKKYHCSDRVAKRMFSFVYLNTAPNVKEK